MGQYLDKKGVAYLSSHIATNYSTELAWGTTKNIAKVGGTYITAKLPSNPNTDHYHTGGGWSGLTYTFTGQGGAANIAVTLPTGKTSYTVALGDHTHKYAGSSSVGGAANSVANSLSIKLNSGTTEGSTLFTFNGSAAKTIDITPSAIGAATSSSLNNYLPLSGGIMTGQLKSSVANGNAPFVVTSKTVVTNLNADKLDGYDASGLFTSFASSGNALSITIGGTNKTLTPPYATSSGTTGTFSSTAEVKLTGDVTGSASSTKGWSVTTALSYTGVTSGNYGPTSNVSPAHKGTFSVPFFNVDSKGRITSATSYTITLPSDSDNNNKVTQNNTSTNANYRLLLSANASDTSETNTSNKSTKFYANAYTGVLTAPTFSGSLSGNATTATTATTAKALSTNAGSTSKPVYFSGGIPVECGTSLAVNITGNAATATSATSSTKLSNNSTFNDTATGGFQYYAANITNITNNANWSAPASGWYQILHNDLPVANYWTELAFPVNDVNGLWWRQRRTSTYSGWFKILDTNNWKNTITLSALGGVSTDTKLTTVNVTGTGNALTTGYISSDYKTLTLYKGTTFSTSDTKITTVSIDGSGNAVTSGSISTDGKTLTLTKGTTFSTTDKYMNQTIETNGAHTRYILGSSDTATGAKEGYKDANFKLVTRQGTTSAQGVMSLYLGNNIASGTANNQYGQMVFYHGGSAATILTSYSGATQTSNNTLTLPSNVSGTIAVTSNIGSANLNIQNNGTTVTSFSSNASSSKSFNLIPGSNVTLTTGSDSITIASTNTNTSHSHNFGVGLTGSGSASTSGGTYTYKAKLKDETANASDSSKSTSTEGGLYSVEVDKSGYLAVRVPWKNNTYTVNNAALTLTTPTSTIGSSFTSNTGTATTYPLKYAYNGYAGLVNPWYSHTTASTGPTAGSNATAVTVNDISTTSGRYYAIEMDSNGRMFVNVPWENTTTTTGSNNSTSKMFLIGATSQATSVTTNSNSSVYATNGVLTATSFTSTTTSSAPFTVSSSTVVTNLNADKLDGKDASAFALSSHTHSNYSLTSHTHTTTIAPETSAVSQLTLAHGTKYKLTAGGTSYVFTAPSCSVSNSKPTLSWGGTSTVGTVDGVSLQVTMPSNPNTDSKASSSDTTSKIYLTGATSQSTSGLTHYSNSKCYAYNSYLYSYGNKVIAENDALTTTEVETICKDILGV